MQVRSHGDPDSFLATVGALLERREAENNMLWGILDLIRTQRESLAGAPLMLSVSRGGEATAAALCTPPWGPAITAAGGAECRALVEFLHKERPDIPTVIGPRPSVDAFAQAWAVRSGRGSCLLHAMRNFRLEKVIVEGDTLTRGQMCQADDTHRALVEEWIALFHIDAGVPLRESAAVQARRLLAGRNVFLWIDGEPVAMVGRVGRTPQGVRIAYVYTRSDRRGRGYATALVASFTQQLLAEGARFGFLFTDADNPTSNAIYERIGYRFVGDFAVFGFEREEG